MDKKAVDNLTTAGADGISRRDLLQSGISAAALLGAGAAVAAPKRASTAQSNNVAGRKFKAWVTRGTGSSGGSLEELTLRPISGRQVVVRTEASQCCYSLANLLLGLPSTFLPPGGFKQATILGHGGVGIVEAIGPQVKRLQVGDRVIIGVTPECGQCANCLQGRADYCNQLIEPLDPIADTADGAPIVINTLLGPGGHSELMVPYEEWCVPVFTDVSPVELSMLACVGSAGLGSTSVIARVRAGSNVVVHGAGPVGLSAIQGARINGATQIIAVEPISARRELALKVGATMAMDPNAEGEHLVEHIRKLCNTPTDRPFAGGRNARPGFAGGGPDFVVVAVGASWIPAAGIPDPTGVQPAQQALSLTPSTGVLTTLGVIVEKSFSSPGLSWSIGGPTHYPSNFGGTHLMRDVPSYVRLIERGLYDAKSLATSTYPLEKIRDAYQAVIDRSTVASVLTFA